MDRRHVVLRDQSSPHLAVFPADEFLTEAAKFEESRSFDKYTAHRNRSPHSQFSCDGRAIKGSWQVRAEQRFSHFVSYEGVASDNCHSRSGRTSGLAFEFLWCPFVVRVEKGDPVPGTQFHPGVPGSRRPSIGLPVICDLVREFCLQSFRRTIRGTIVHHDDLVWRPGLGQCASNCPAYQGTIVVRRNHNTNARCLRFHWLNITLPRIPLTAPNLACHFTGAEYRFNFVMQSVALRFRECG